MKVNKKVIGSLEKCYSLARLNFNNRPHFLVAAEKHDECRLYDAEGNFIKAIWQEPGGTMSMVQVPGSNGQFLATHKFYSPNDSKEAKIVMAVPDEAGNWSVKTLAELPFVHRFDIIHSNGVNYLIACTLKSGHEYKDDWSQPGKVYAAVLPEDLSGFNEHNQLELTVIKSGMLKNHGYCRHLDDEGESAVISCEQGVFHFFPPKDGETEWRIDELLTQPSSDAVLIDLDDDGICELVTFSPFHGDSLSVYKKRSDGYEMVYCYPEKLEFLHAIISGRICGKNRVIVGHRNGERKLLSLTMDNAGAVHTELLDKDCGAADVLTYVHNASDILIAANREINEIAMYRLEDG